MDVQIGSSLFRLSRGPNAKILASTEELIFLRKQINKAIGGDREICRPYHQVNLIDQGEAIDRELP